MSEHNHIHDTCSPCNHNLATDTETCEFCQALGGTFIYRDSKLRVINANDSDFPMYTRVIWEDHSKEMTDLSIADRHYLMDHIYLIEGVQRNLLKAVKVNLAQFGNVVPHLHWHVIPRFSWDLRYPNSFWSDNMRERDDAYLAKLAELYKMVPEYHAALLDAFIKHSIGDKAVECGCN
ncbi:HIT family protein [Taylorella asinigenitalis]|uniref:HIT family protein n=1 Tax=Taylorella asinigenitalis TaxID=84590 RepID=UPI0004915751|nr:HIT family protein [Taylorella asinigenitalis]